MTMRYDERVETCREVDDPDVVHMIDTMLARKRSERLDKVVVQQLRIDLATYLSLDVCIDDDLRLAQRLGMPDVLASPRHWAGMEELLRGSQYLGT